MGDREQLANRSSGAKDSGTSGNIGVQYQSDAYIPAGQPVVAFVHCTVEVEITQTISGNTITIDFLRPNATGTAYVYFSLFSHRQSQTTGWPCGCFRDADFNKRNAHAERCCHPRYRRGGCQLRIQHQYNSGGKWACMPAMLGLITGLYPPAVSRSPTRPYTRAWQSLREAIRGYSPCRRQPRAATFRTLRIRI